MTLARRLTIGVDLGGTNARAGLVSEEKIVRLAARPIRAQGSENEVFEDLCAVIDEVLTEGGRDEVSGLGVGVPGLVDIAEGEIFDLANIPSWKHVRLGKRLRERYDLPVRVDNDANCFALGERCYGFGREAESFVGLIIGTGLGAGIISQGRLHSGVDCAAGEFGMIPYLDSVVERYASGQFFRRAGREGSELARLAQAGDAGALALFDEYGRHLGNALSIILFALAPEMVILGGSVSRSFRFFEGALREVLGRFAYPSISRKLKLRVSQLDHVAVLGAASLVSAS